MMRQTQVRNLLRELGVKVVHVDQSDSLSDFAPARYQEAFDFGAQVPEKVRDLTDCAMIVFRIVAQKLERTGAISDRQLREPLYRLVIASVTDWLLFSHLQLDTRPSLVSYMMQNRTSIRASITADDTANALSAHLKSGATRDFLILVCDTYLDVDLHKLLEAADLPLPDRAPEPTPMIVKHFHPVQRPIQYWTTRGKTGRVAFVVYFSPACTYRICLGCALPDLSSNSAIRPIDMIEQTDYLFRKAFSSAELATISTLVISNNGSVLDEPTFPQAALLHAIQVALARMPRLKVISLETRAEFVSLEKMRAIRKAIDISGREDVKFELSLGVEIFDERKRNKIIRKGLSNKAIHRLLSDLGETGGGLRCYFMLKSLPGMSDAEAIDDLDQAIRFFDEASSQTGVDIVLHVNPTYAAVGTELEKAFQTGTFTPPDLNLLVEYLRGSAPERVALHFGLNDEGLAVEGGSFDLPSNAAAIELLDQINRSGLEAAGLRDPAPNKGLMHEPGN